MTLLTYKIIAALIIFLISIIAVIYPLIQNRRDMEHVESLELGEALASGIFLGVAFLHMLPDAIAAFGKLYPNIGYPIAEATSVGGFLLLLFLERLSLSSTRLGRHAIPYLLVIILVIHSLTEGAALGIGKNFTEAFMIFIAIIAHKGSASFALCVTLLRYQLRFSVILSLILIFSVMTPLGISLGAVINHLTQSARGELMAAYFNAFAAGTFIYISILHHINFHQRIEKSEALLEFSFLTLGLVSMAIIAFWV